jgi:hypothetical protein
MFSITRSAYLMRLALPLGIALLLVLSTRSLAFGSSSQVTLEQLSQDPYTNGPPSEHKTQVEPDTFFYSSTIVSAFQSGRFFGGGASNVGWATSTDDGATWQHGFLPGTTPYATPPGPYGRLSDSTVSFDARHNTWLIASLAMNMGARGIAIIVNQSTDGGLTWNNPVVVASTQTSYLDKDWIVCDNTSTSKFYGNCYVEWDDFGNRSLMQMSTSSDGGATWGAAKHTAKNARGLGGQPLVQPNGTVIVPYASRSGDIESYSSTNGGKSWNAPVDIATIEDHPVAGKMRSEPLPSAEIDGAGTVYVAWHDCRFENNCSANDIVYSSSSDGITWSAVQRVPIDPVNSGVDHFIPGLAVDTSTSGSSAHIAVTYYYFPNASCSNDCQLDVGYISSTNGGASWSASQQLAGPMNPTWLANTNQGYMVGDYISTSIVANGSAYPAFAVATAPTAAGLNESIFTVTGGLPVTGGNIV